MRNRFVSSALTAAAVLSVALLRGDAQVPARTERQPLGPASSTSPQTLAATAAGCFDVERYSEDFETGWASNWYLGPGFQIVAGEAGKNLVGGGASAALASYLSGDYWADFFLGLKMKLISGETWVSFRYNTDGVEDYPYDRIRPTVSHRYYAAFTSGSASLVRDDAGTLRVLGSASTTFAPGQSYAIGIFAVGGSLSLYVNNALLISVTDASPVASGSINLETKASASVQFDDLQVLANVPCEGTWTQAKTYPLGVDINAIVSHPSNANLVYAGTEHGGLWKSTDGGLTWAEVGYTGGMIRLGKTRTIAVTAADSNAVFVGWGDSELDRSNDGGLHWAQTSLQGTPLPRVWAAAVHPGNASLVYVAMGEGTSSTFSQGLYKSPDAGSTFQLILNAPAYSVVIAASDPKVLYVGTKTGISRSTDGGVTWTTVYSATGTLPNGVPSIAVDPSSANTVYAVADKTIKSTDGGNTWSIVWDQGAEIVISPSRPEVLYLMAGANILRSGDHGSTWTTIGKPSTSKPYNMQHIAVDSSNPDKVFAGTWGQGIFISTDRGATWSAPTMLTGPADLGVAVAIHPTDNKSVYVGTSKGEIYRTADAGDNWTRLANLGTGNGYQSLITGLVIDPLHPATIFASNLDGIYKTTDGGVTWQTITTGLTDSRIISLAVDPKNPDRVYAGTSNSRPRNITDGTGMFYSANGGASWSHVSGLPAAPIPSIVVNALNPNVIYAAAIGYGIYKSVDAGASWTQVNSGLESQGCVYTLAADPRNPDVAYAGTSNTSYCKSVVGKADNVYKTIDGGTTWKVSRKGETHWENIENIAVDPSNPSNVYVTNHTERIWFSGDAGSTWKLANQNVIRHGAHLYLWALAVDSSGGMVYLVTCGRGILKNAVKAQESSSTAGPVVGLSPSALRFAALKTGGTLTSTSAQTATISQTGTGPVAWNAAANQSWVTISPTSGSGTSTFSISINNTGGALSGTQSATITVTMVGASNTSLSLPITLTVYSTGSTSAPFGVVDTPASGATVQGAIPMTGWALDDIGVNRVEAWRNCLEAIDRSRGACVSPAAGLTANYVFLGKAFLLAGARPDVEALNPTYPLAYRAGWGFMLLTNALPHQIKGTTVGGQGSYVLSAFAIDEEARASLLGTKTIAVDNDHATVPFGAIDTPVQGGTIPEAAAPYNNVNAYPVFGWAMTELGKCIATTSTSAYKVFIDGVQRSLTPGSNWFAGLNRADLAAAYPGLCNSTNALAMYQLNASALGLTTGLHTVSWDVTDSAGQTVAGLGTRFFNIVTSGADALDDAGAKPRTTTAFHSSGANPLTDVVSGPGPASNGSSRTVTARIGGADAKTEAVLPDSSGRRVVQLPVARRLHLDLGGAVAAGYQRVGDDRRALPSGSTLDAAASTFDWEPPVGFFGPFTLVFVAGDERIDVTVTMVDGTAPPAAIAMYVDRPIDGAAITGPLTVDGWALDPQATTGTGIDAVHVWAVRRDVPGFGPQFIGAATLRLPRPDVEQVFGAQFQAAGFELTATVPAGMYDVTAYALNRRTGRFDDTRTVRVIVR